MNNVEPIRQNKENKITTVRAVAGWCRKEQISSDKAVETLKEFNYMFNINGKEQKVSATSIAWYLLGREDEAKVSSSLDKAIAMANQAISEGSLKYTKAKGLHKAGN